MTIHPQNHRNTSASLRANNARIHPGSAAPRFTGTIDELVANLKPAQPLYVLRPQVLTRTAREFTALFPGDVMYAVKCNPEKTVLQTLYKAGVKSFDVASIEEVRLAAKAAPKAKLYFMHPVKAPEAIREAYSAYGVRAFAVDTQEELFKILQETGLAPDLELFVRIALPKNGSAAIDFRVKFGAMPEDAATLLQQCRPVVSRLGISFHVGTQTTNPAVFARAVNIAADVMMKSGVKVDVVDVGGGFPVSYPGQAAPPPLEQYMKSIAGALKKCGLSDIPLLCEPGRALVAASTSLVVRVEQRRGDLLYINDGTYGGLFDAGRWLNLRYPVRRVGGGDASHETAPFRFAGPTCDSLDMMAGPFDLPSGIKTGDWIEIGNTGAYSRGLRGNFNGFGGAQTVALHEPSGAELSV